MKKELIDKYGADDPRIAMNGRRANHEEFFTPEDIFNHIFFLDQRSGISRKKVRANGILFNPSPHPKEEKKINIKGAL